MSAPLPRSGPADGVTALLLDDDRIDRRRLARLLAQAGLRVAVSEAADIAGFALALDRQPYDLIFIDYALAGATGLDALALVKAHPLQRQAAPIMVTGRGQLEIAVTAMRQGCVDYLTKDQLTPQVLRGTIATAVERQLLAPALKRGAGAQAEGAIARFSAASVDELQAIMRGMLDRSRGLRTRADDRAQFFEDVAAIEDSCERIWGLIGAPPERLSAEG
jgi:DNA-binding NtrC family response regulator